MEGGKKKEETFLLSSGPISNAPTPQMVDCSLWLLHDSCHQPLHAPPEVPAAVRSGIPSGASTNHAMLPLPLGVAPFHSVHPPEMPSPQKSKHH